MHARETSSPESGKRFLFFVKRIGHRFTLFSVIAVIRPLTHKIWSKVFSPIYLPKKL